MIKAIVTISCFHFGFRNTRKAAMLMELLDQGEMTRIKYVGDGMRAVLDPQCDKPHCKMELCAEEKPTKTRKTQTPSVLCPPSSVI